MSVLRALRERIRSLGHRTDTTNVAIACQGGGSHAAFTAGVLDTLSSELGDSHRIVGFSGASGGAVCATAAWYGLLADDETPGSVLDAVWSEIAAETRWERWVNELTLFKSRSGSRGSNPYKSKASDWTRQHLESVLTENINFDDFDGLAADHDPALLVSAANVTTGEPTVFANGDVTPAAVVASAAVPQLFEAVDVDGEYYWDGFLAGNPPLWDLLVDDSVPPVDELWIVQLTPTTTESVPKTSDGIEERTQQMVENLSLARDRQFVETVNDWLASGKLADSRLSAVEMHTIELHREQAEESRLNRRESFISGLYEDGQAEAVNFLREQGARV